MPKYSFEELKMMYESAEKATERRFSVTKFNYSINAGIIIANALILNRAIDKSDYFYLALIMIIVLSGLGIYLCRVWIHQLKYYQNLNAAKFHVINKMSKNLSFGSDNNHVELISYEPFKCEWKKFQENMKSKEKAPNAEYYLPKGFIFIYILVIVLSPFITIIH
jgi:hypothetical protein